MKLKYKNWNEITISKYNAIQEIINNSTDDITRDAELLAVLCDVDVDDIWSTKTNEIAALREQLAFTSSIDFPKTFKKKHLQVGEIECDVVVDLSKYTYGQYVDFKNYYADDAGISKLLSTILIPRGKKYNEGYDVVEMIKTIEDNVSIIDANAICFFFLLSYLTSIRRTNRSLLGRMTIAKIMMSKKNKKYKTLTEAIKNSKTIDHLLSSALSKK